MSGDTPNAGLYKIRRVRHGPWVGVRLWFDTDRTEPGNPENKLDRSAIWRCEIDGQEVELLRAWPQCERNPVDRKEYRWLLADASHARRHRPAAPEANPTHAVDIGSMPALF